MGFRARRSIKIAPGVRLNVSAKSVGVSGGVRGARVSVNSRRGVTTTVGVPGTGVSYSSTSRKPPQPAAPLPAAPPRPKKIKPGLMAPAWEKTLYKQIQGPPDAAAIQAAGQENPSIAATAVMVEILRIAYPTGDQPRMRALLNWIFDSGYDPTTDPFMTKYFGVVEMTVPIAEGITAQLPWDRQAIGLLLAELEQAHSNLTRATDVVEQLEPTTIAAVSLAELYAEQGRWPDIVELTNGLSNDDDAAMFLLVQRGMALREQKYFEAAREALKEALRVRSRPPVLRHLALVARGGTHLVEGKKAMARKDFERVLAEDASYPDLQELLTAAQ